MMELVDMRDLGSRAATRWGSSPHTRTNFILEGRMMQVSVCKDTLTMFLSGRIDSSNAAGIENDAMQAVKSNPGHHIVIDAENLEYISSAGLRVLLKLARIDPEASLVNASRDVFEIMEMTGFTNILHVERALRKFSVDGCPVIGKGATATLYQYDRDTIVKVYLEGTRMESLVKERDRSQLAFTHGVPSRIFYDIVKVGNCYGAIYEMIDSCSLGHTIADTPSCAEEMAVKFASIGRMIHSIDASDLGLPRIKDSYLAAAEKLAFLYSDAENQAILDMIEAMPEGSNMLHGDFTPKNIMIQDGEPLLIDLGDISIGHPIYDLSIAYFIICWIRNADSVHSTGIPLDRSFSFFDSFIRSYFNTDDDSLVMQLRTTIHAAAGLRAAIILGITPTIREELVQVNTSMLREKFFPNVPLFLDQLRNAKDLFQKFSCPG